jgi:SAM-dependent methyltransferase
MTVTRDGSPVDVYRHLPAAGEAELIHEAIPAGATVLDLGCGTGRIARVLASLGHAVTGVDDSAAMLAELPVGVTGVEADVGEVRLGRRFDAVLLASHLVNAGPEERDPFLATARAHVEADGSIVAEVYPSVMDWAARVGRTHQLGPVAITVERATVRGDEVDAEVSYRLDDRVWRQPFVATMLDEPALRGVLDVAGFAFERWLDEARGWFQARPRT